MYPVKKSKHHRKIAVAYLFMRMKVKNKIWMDGKWRILFEWYILELKLWTHLIMTSSETERFKEIKDLQQTILTVKWVGEQI